VGACDFLIESTERRMKGNQSGASTTSATITRFVVKEQSVALLAVTISLACRLALDPFLGDHLPYVSFFGAIAFTTWYGGLVPALTATLLGGLAAVWFFIPPRYSLVVHDLSQQVGFFAYVAVSLTFVGFGEVMHRARQRAEILAQGLRLMEERLALAQHASQIGSFDWNLETGVNVWSPELYAIYGIKPEDFGNTQTAWEGYVHPDDREAMRQAVEQSRSSGDAVEREFRIVRPGGEVRWLVGRWRWLTDANGQPVRLTGVNFDITERKQADEVVREGEAGTRAIFESSLDALITMDPDGRIQDFNPAAEQMFGYSHSEAVGRIAADLIIPPHLRERHRQALRRYLDSDAAMVLGQRVQMPALRADGREIPVELSIAVTRRPGRPPFFTASVRDVSERLRSERATAHLAAIVTSTDDAIISKDLKGIVTSWNQGAERLFGYRADEMIGESVTKLIPPDRQGEERRILDKISRGEIVETYETLRRRKDGTDFHVSLTISPLFDGQGRVIGASKIARNITDRVQQEYVLAQSRERLRQALQYQEAVFNNIGEGLYTVNRQGLVVSVNRAAERLFGWSKEELVGRKMHDLVHYKHPDGRPFASEDCAVLSIFQHGANLLNRDDVFIRKDGSFFDVVFSASPIRSGDEITGLVVVFRDVTERKRAEDALRDRDRALTAANDELNQQKVGLSEANKELQSFSYSVSHDLRAPLRTIDAYVRIVEEDHGPDLNDEVRRCLGIVKKAAGQAGELIDDLLEFSRLGRIGMDIRMTNMTQIAREAVEELVLTRNREHIDLTIGDLPGCFGDWRLLKLVWMNLLSNAFKFTCGQGVTQIEIGWLPDDRQADACVYYVKDNGVGFDMKYVHKLFGVFQRLHLKDEFEGTGVGLAIVQRIVQRHGGRVWAEGKINGGATFFFSLRKAM
jgi:PAS domain S-box-containing protein